MASLVQQRISSVRKLQSNEYTLMDFKKIMTSITGLSCPIFGIQWQPPVLDVSIAEDVVTYLEDKRVLYRPTDLENADQCLQSVLGIRSELTLQLQKIQTVDSHLGKSLKRMRQSARVFCDKIDNPTFKTTNSIVQQSLLARELNTLREKFGKSIAEISVSYGLDIEDDLASIIPFNNP